MAFISNSHLSANVYTRIYDFTARVKGLSISTGALVGWSDQGPVKTPVLVTDTKEFIERFGKPHPSKGWMHYSALAFLAQSSALWVSRVDTHALTGGAYCTVDDPEASVPLISMDNFNDGLGNAQGIYDPLNTLGFIESDPGIPNILFYVCAENPGEWNNRLFIRILPNNPTGYDSGVLDDPTLFVIEVYLDYTSPNDYPLERFVVSRDIRVDGFGSTTFIEDVINKRSKYIRVKNNPYSNPLIPVKTSSFVFIDGATNGNPATLNSIVQGWDVFSDPETADVGLLINGGYADPAVHAKMDQIASTRQDCFAILDAPSLLQQANDLINYRQNTLNINSKFSALYAPDVYVYDRYSDRSLFVPISGYAAGLLAKVEATDTIWSAASGTRRGLLAVDDIRYRYSLPQRDALTDAGINMVRRMKDGRFCIWNNATLWTTPSDSQILSVMRLMAYIVKSLAASQITALFEDNNDSLRSKIVANITAFLEPIRLNGGIAELAVVCDQSNNPSYLTANGDLVVDVAVDAGSTAPVRRILFRAVVNKTGSMSTNVSGV